MITAPLMSMFVVPVVYMRCSGASGEMRYRASTPATMLPHR